jgi:hypothetical protein
MSEGYIYCLSNESMPGLVKVGMTATLERTPVMRAKELSAHTSVPTSFKVEFAKLVSNPKQKEQTLHVLLSQYTTRINVKREFFRTSPEEVMKFFDLTEGTMWEDKKKIEDEDEDEDEDEYEDEDEEEDGRIRNTPNYVPKDIFQDQVILRQVLNGTEFKGKYDATTDQFITDEGVFHTSLRKWNIANSNAAELKYIPNCWISFKVYDGEKYVRIAGCRDITKCFTNGQRIRHTIGINKTWIGTYDSSCNKIFHNGKFYKSLSGFANTHHRENGSYTHNGVSGWKCTDYEVDGKWVSTSNI